jgi:hypothetical protein
MKAKGVNKKVSYVKESVWGELGGPAGGKQLRRVTFDANLVKESYSSEEIRTDYQIADMRHGVRSTEGSLSTELSPGSYSDFIGSVLAKDFAAVAGLTSLEVTIATSGTNFTITRTAGDFLTGGVKVGSVIRLTGAGLNAANVGNNLLVIAVTATVLTVKVLSATALVAEGPIASVDVTYPGKQSYVPLTGHTDDSYTIEQWYSDIKQSEVFTGNRVGSASISLPATGLVTADFSFMGKDLARTGTTEYMTSPAPANTYGIFASVQGALLVNGTEGACITDASIEINREQEPAQCVGSNFASEIFTGTIGVTGSMSAYFSDATLRDYFDNETEVSVVLALTTSEDKDADFMSFVLPRVKLGSYNHADAQLGIVDSIDYTALLKAANTQGLIESTIMVQDSRA